MRIFQIVKQAIAGGSNWLARATAGVSVENRTSGTPTKPDARAGVEVLPLWLTRALVAANAGISCVASVAGVLTKPEARAGIALSAILQQTPGQPPPGATGPAQTGLEIVKFWLSLTHRSGIVTATSTGPNAITNPANAQGMNDGSGATGAGNLTAARTYILEGTYVDLGASKSPMAITAVRLHFYVIQNGTLLNNGDLRLRYDVGAGPVTLATFTGNIATFSPPQTYDITAAVGGDWSKVDALKSIVEARMDAGELGISFAVDAVEMEVEAYLEQV